MWLFCCWCCCNIYCTIELYLIFLLRDAKIFREGTDRYLEVGRPFSLVHYVYHQEVRGLGF